MWIFQYFLCCKAVCKNQLENFLFHKELLFCPQISWENAHCSFVVPGNLQVQKNFLCDLLLQIHGASERFSVPCPEFLCEDDTDPYWVHQAPFMWEPNPHPEINSGREFFHENIKNQFKEWCRQKKLNFPTWLVQSPEGEVIYLVDMGRKK